MDEIDELAEYDYLLPEDLIARQPPERREDARLLVVDRSAGSIRHTSIRNLPDYLQAGDRLTLNNTRVIPARLIGQRAATGGYWEGLFLSATPEGNWQLLGQTRGKLLSGEQIHIRPPHETGTSAQLALTLMEKDEAGIWTARPDTASDFLETLQRFGTVPLPPYLGRKLANTDDFLRYQTVYAAAPGSVAAPTAGLHFTEQLLSECLQRGVEKSFVTLHVGIGTFRPITVKRFSEHRMHLEWCDVSDATAAELLETRSKKGRIVAVGTTTVRTLETAANSGEIRPYHGSTDLFIRPPYQFRAVDVLLTNFHLPRSSLLVLVSAFAGKELIREVYATAVREKYRFFSYGDAMLIV